jgi:hypothetical protein
MPTNATVLFNRIMAFAYNTCAPAAISVKTPSRGPTEDVMYEPNWTLRIIVFSAVVLVFGLGVAGYYESNEPPPHQHVTQVVPNDRLP